MPCLILDVGNWIKTLGNNTQCMRQRCRTTWNSDPRLLAARGRVVMGVNEQEMLGLALGWDRIHYRVVILIVLPGRSWVESSEVRNWPGNFASV